MIKILLLPIILIALTACQSLTSYSEPISWESIKGDLKPINPNMITHVTMTPITTPHDK